MPKKKFSIFNFQFSILFLLFTICYLLFAIPTQAQNSSCDLCGWCGLGYENKPKDWEGCMRCLFPERSKGLQPILTPGQVYPTNKPKPYSLSDDPYYPSTPERAKNWTVVGCLDTAPGGFVGQAYKIILAIGSGFAFLAFVYGGFTVLTAGGDPQKVTSGKNIIMGAIFGLLLIVFSVFLLRLIGFQIIKIPGFE